MAAWAGEFEDFYLGAHQPGWLARAGVPLFVAAHRLAPYKKLPKAIAPWALDSGGFGMLQHHGRWTFEVWEYVAAVARYQREIGMMRWAAQMDWMCEEAIIRGGQFGRATFVGTHLPVMEHQHRTVENYLALHEIWPQFSDLPCPVIPVIQGYSNQEYYRCIELFRQAGVDLTALPVVGLGSVCRRQNTLRVQWLIQELAEDIRLHGFGMKTLGLGEIGHLLASADSMAWSFDALFNPPMPGHTHKSCSNCLEWALDWRRDMLDRKMFRPAS